MAVISYIGCDRGNPVSILSPTIPSLPPAHLMLSRLASVLTPFHSQQPLAPPQNNLSVHTRGHTHHLPTPSSTPPKHMIAHGGDFISAITPD